MLSGTNLSISGESYCSRLEGVPAMPFDLVGSVSMLLEVSFHGSHMEMQTIYMQAIANKITWQQVLTMVGTEYQTLLGMD